MEALVDATATIATVTEPAALAETLATVDTETEAAPATVTRPATTEKTRPVARLEVKPVGVGAGAVIRAASHVVTEGGMGTFIVEAVEAALAPGPRSATTGHEARNAATTTIAGIAAVTTIVGVVETAGTALPATPRLPS